LTEFIKMRFAVCLSVFYVGFVILFHFIPFYSSRFYFVLEQLSFTIYLSFFSQSNVNS